MTSENRIPRHLESLNEMAARIGRIPEARTEKLKGPGGE